MVSLHDQYAEDYDKNIRAYDCYLSEVLFGLSFEYIQQGEVLLDVGIGTGISSSLFHAAGLSVFGIDSSAAMLDICQSKNFARELTEQDLLAFPWPYRDALFDHVICCGVFHFIGDLDGVFSEISRVLKAGGLFAFTVMDGPIDLPEGGKFVQSVVDGIDIFSHNTAWLNELLHKHHYRVEKVIVCLVGKTPFRVIAARKN